MEVYERTNTGPISVDIIEQRWTAMGHNLRLQEETPANRVMKQYFRRRMTNADPVRKASRRGRVLTAIPRLLQLDLLSLSKTARQNHFNVPELSTGTDLEWEILRNRAQNQILWRKGVDAIIEDYKRKWTERENKLLHMLLACTFDLYVI